MDKRQWLNDNGRFKYCYDMDGPRMIWISTHGQLMWKSREHNQEKAATDIFDRVYETLFQLTNDPNIMNKKSGGLMIK